MPRGEKKREQKVLRYIGNRAGCSSGQTVTTHGEFVQEIYVAALATAIRVYNTQASITLQSLLYVIVGGEK